MVIASNEQVFCVLEFPEGTGTPQFFENLRHIISRRSFVVERQLMFVRGPNDMQRFLNAQSLTWILGLSRGNPVVEVVVRVGGDQSTRLGE